MSNWKELIDKDEIPHFQRLMDATSIADPTIVDTAAVTKYEVALEDASSHLHSIHARELLESLHVSLVPYKMTILARQAPHDAMVAGKHGSKLIDKQIAILDELAPQLHSSRAKMQFDWTRTELAVQGISPTSASQLRHEFIKKYPDTICADQLRDDLIRSAEQTYYGDGTGGDFLTMAYEAKEAAAHARTPKSRIERIGRQTYAMAATGQNVMAILDKLLDEQPNEAPQIIDIICDRAAQNASLGKRSEAFDLWTLAYEKAQPSQRSIRLLVGLADSTDNMQRHSKSIDYLKELVDRHPNDPLRVSYEFRIGATLMLASRLAEARKYYERVVASKAIYPGFATQRLEAEEAIRDIDQQLKKSLPKRTAAPAASNASPNPAQPTRKKATTFSRGPFAFQSFLGVPRYARAP